MKRINPTSLLELKSEPTITGSSAIYAIIFKGTMCHEILPFLFSSNHSVWAPRKLSPHAYSMGTRTWVRSENYEYCILHSKVLYIKNLHNPRICQV